MLSPDLCFRGPGRRRTLCRFGCLSVLVALSITIEPSCGLDNSASRTEVSSEIIRGKDSAGATIELKKRGNDLTRARVIDVVLGTGEAEIISGNDGYVEFTLQFPGGPAITYRGQQAEVGALKDMMVSGTWHQHPGGVFGADLGTWEAPSPSNSKP